MADKSTENLSPEMLSRKVQSAFYDMVKEYKGPRFQSIIEPDRIALSGGILSYSGKLSSAIYDRCIKGVGELKQSSENKVPAGTFFRASLHRRKGFDDLYLACLLQSTGIEIPRVTLQTNDTHYMGITCFKWGHIELRVPDGYEEKPEPDRTGENPTHSARKKTVKEEESPKTIEEICLLEQTNFETAIKKLGGQRFRVEDYKGPLITNDNGIIRISSCQFTSLYNGFIPDLSSYNRNEIPDGAFLRGQICVRPASKKYLAAVTLSHRPFPKVFIETNDKSIVKNSLDTWRRVEVKNE